MQFNSYTFVIFFAVVVAVQMSPLSWRVKKLNLLVASYAFYAAWRVPYVLLIWLSTVVDWQVAKALGNEEDPARRRFFLIASLASNLGLLGVFKYTNFVLGTVTSVSHATGSDWAAPTFDIILPVGISFYTFQTLSYTIDVYRRAMRPAESFLDYALYVAFFPQLVAGPIVRAIEFLPQCLEFKKPTAQDLGWGLTLMLLGCWEKAVCADGLLAPVVEQNLSYVKNIDFVHAWLGVLAFAGQILFDFAGYSSCAIGAARILGFRLPVNFRFPYAAVGFSDFWARWHISLSGWLRDYLFVSLSDAARRAHRGAAPPPNQVYINLTITMLLGGLWHGASWNFVIWGGIHGLLLVAERIVRASVPRAFGQHWVGRFLGWAVTFGGVCIAYVFFRVPGFKDALRVVKVMFLGPIGDLPFVGALDAVDYMVGYTVLVMGLLLALSWRLRHEDLETWTTRLHPVARGLMGAAMVLSMCTLAGKNRAFIYFQF